MTSDTVSWREGLIKDLQNPEFAERFLANVQNQSKEDIDQAIRIGWKACEQLMLAIHMGAMHPGYSNLTEYLSQRNK